MKRSSSSSSSPSDSLPVATLRCTRGHRGTRPSPADNRRCCRIPAIPGWDHTRSVLQPTYGIRSGRSPAVRHSDRSWGRRRPPHCRRQHCRCWNRVPRCRRFHFHPWTPCPHRQPVEDRSRRSRWIRNSTCSRRCWRSSREFHPTSKLRIHPGARLRTRDSSSRSSIGANSRRASTRRPNTGVATQSRRDPSRTRVPHARHIPSGQHTPNDLRRMRRARLRIHRETLN
jgi:hypothetical protein